MKTKKIAALFVLSLLVISVFPFAMASHTSSSNRITNADKGASRALEKDFSQQIRNLDDEVASGLIGDVNGDGVINIADPILLASYVTSRGKTRHTIVVENSDLNGDGRIDWKDVVLSLNNQFWPEQTLKGDADNNGVLNIADAVMIGDYIGGKFVIPHLKNADFYEDPDRQGEVNFHDLMTLLNHMYMEESEKGDVNNDGNVDISDIVALSKYLNFVGTKVINTENADVNDDGFIDMEDILALQEMLFGSDDDDDSGVLPTTSTNDDSSLTKGERKVPQKRTITKPTVRKPSTSFTR